MKNRTIKWVLLIAFLAMLSGIASAVDKNYGDSIGEYRSIATNSQSVIAYSNGACVATYAGNCANLPVYNKYQCVEYVKRFFRDAMLMDTSSWSGDGHTYYEKAAAGTLNPSLTPYVNGGSTPPQPDDLLGFSGGPGGYGHVAIITEVGADYVMVIEQNVARNDAIHRIPYNKAANRIGDANGNRWPGTTYTLHIDGWLRKPGARIVTQSILCKNQACSTTSVAPGDELTFVYSINNPTVSNIDNVRLGAQIRTNSPQGIWQDNNINDQIVTVTPGTKDYTRKFIIPTAAIPGFYDIRGVILNHGTGVWIDSKELTRIFEVKTATTTPPYSSFYEGAIVTNGVANAPAWLLKNNLRQKIADIPTFWSLYNSNGKRYYYFSDADINKIPQGPDIKITQAYDPFYEGAIVTTGAANTPAWLLKNNVRQKIADIPTFWSIYNSNGKRYYYFSDADINKIPQGPDIKIP